MAKLRRTWKTRLTKAQRRHVREWCGDTLDGLKRNLAHQDTGAIPCWDCREIARRVGIEIHQAK